MQYVLIENGKIVKGPCVLPKSTKNISGFDKLPDMRLKEYGWLPVEGFNHNAKTQNRSEPDIQADKVVYTITDKPLAEVITTFVPQFKPMAAQELASTDWKVIRHLEQITAGVKTSLTSDEFVALALERQAIRENSNIKEQAIKDAKTIAEVLSVRYIDEEIM